MIWLDNFLKKFIQIMRIHFKLVQRWRPFFLKNKNKKQRELEVNIELSYREQAELS